MTNSRWKEVLWNDASTVDSLLEQYRLAVESSQNVSQWRASANALHLSISGLLLAGFGFLFQQSSNTDWLFAIGLLSGWFLAFNWFSLLLHYKRLNRAKFAVIHELETRLCVAPFNAEWEYVGRGKDYGKYWPVSHLEMTIPFVFAAAELAIVICAWIR